MMTLTPTKIEAQKAAVKYTELFYVLPAQVLEN